MQVRAKSAPKLRKIDVRVPVPNLSDELPFLGIFDHALLCAVDGVATVHAIAADAGLSDEDVADALEKLERLGVIMLGAASPRPAVSSPQRLSSGVRPALKTLPTEAMQHEVDDLLAACESEEGERLTLNGLGPHAAVG